MARLSILLRVKTRPVWLHWTQNDSIQDYTGDSVQGRLGGSTSGDRKTRSETVNMILARW